MTTPAPNLRRRWPGVVLVVAILLLPVGLGAAVGWFGLNPRAAEPLSPTAAFAHELLNSFPDSTLVVEIAAPPGELPPSSSIAVLWSRMNETLQKGSIQFVLETYSPPATTSWAISDLWNLETSVRSHWPGLGTMALFYLFVDGQYAGGSSVLGLSYYGSSIAVFPGVITSNLPSNYVGPVTSTVLVHEFGHEMGLVGLVGSAPNEDPNHPGHSTDPNDVMYWQVETVGVLGGILGGPPPPTQFDAQDRADLSTVRGTPILQEVLPWVVLGLLLVLAVLVYWLYVRGRRPTPIAPS